MDDTVTLLKKYKALLEAQQEGRPLTHFEVIKELTSKGIPYTEDGLKSAIKGLESVNNALKETKSTSAAERLIISTSEGHVSSTTPTVDGVRMSVSGNAAGRGNRVKRPTEMQALIDASERER